MFAQIKLYLAFGLLAAFLALGGIALWYRGEAISATAAAAQAKADLATATAANKAQQATIGRLRASAEANDRIIAQMSEQIADINTAMSETSRQIGALKDANEDVRAYLATAVPADLERLLNTPARSGGGPAGHP